VVSKERVFEGENTSRKEVGSRRDGRADKTTRKESRNAEIVRILKKEKTENTGGEKPGRGKIRTFEKYKSVWKVDVGRLVERWGKGKGGRKPLE